MKPEVIGSNYPSQYESRLVLKNGREILLRPILPTDEHQLVALFDKLSPQSIYLRFLRDLPALPKDMLHRFTHLDYDSEFALAGIVEEDGAEAVIAVARYAYSPSDSLADLAVAVRDDWQHLGLGKALLKRIVEIGGEHGMDRFGGMLDPGNKIIRQVLSDLGYNVIYTLRDGFFQVEIQA